MVGPLIVFPLDGQINGGVVVGITPRKLKNIESIMPRVLGNLGMEKTRNIERDESEEARKARFRGAKSPGRWRSGSPRRQGSGVLGVQGARRHRILEGGRLGHVMLT